MTSKGNESKSCCKWCEDQNATIELYSKSKGEILGFCSDQCWTSYTEVLFEDRCPKCNEKANLLLVPAANKDDLESEEFTNYCDKCFSVDQKIGNISKSTPKNSTPSSRQLITPKSEKFDCSQISNCTPPAATNKQTTTPTRNTNHHNESSSSLNSNASDSGKLLNNSASSAKRSRSFKNHQPYEIWGCFNWENYLQLEGSTPAPAECFRQNKEPPANEFELNMKLEAPDPRNPSSTCIATVVSMLGSRIELRLDGSDNTNDFWLLVDSEEIKSIGYTQEQGGMLQPPLGFRKSPSNWPVFVTNTLSNAVIAPKNNFKAPPIAPNKNLFKVGHKLEAVDRKNPQLICPATISKIQDSMVFVSFDGWKGAFDYWTRFDSRDLFPVGWCERSQHPLQMPGNKDLKIDSSKLSVNYNVTILYQTSKVKNSRASFVSYPNVNSTPKASSPQSLNFSANENGNAGNNSTVAAVKSTNVVAPVVTSTQPTVTTVTASSSTATNIKTITISTSKTATSIKNQNNSLSHQSSSSLRTLLLDSKQQQQQQQSQSQFRQNTPSDSQPSSQLQQRPQSSKPSSVAQISVKQYRQNKPPTTPNSSLSQSEITPSLSLNSSNSNSNSVSTASDSVKDKKLMNGVSSDELTPVIKQQATSHVNSSANHPHSHSLFPNQQIQNTHHSSSAQPNKSDISKHPLVTVHLNINCNSGQFINPLEYKRLVSQCNSKIGPSQLNKTMKDILQLIVNSSKRDFRVYILEMIRPGNGSFEVDTGIVENGAEKKMKLPHFNRASAFWNYLNNFLGGLKCCANLVSMMPVECKQCSIHKSNNSLTNNHQKESLLNHNHHTNQSLKQMQQQFSANKSQPMIKQQAITKPAKLNQQHLSTSGSNSGGKAVTIMQKNNVLSSGSTNSRPISKHSNNNSSTNANHQASVVSATTVSVNASPNSVLKRKSDESNAISNKIAKTNGHHQVHSASTTSTAASVVVEATTTESTELLNPNNWSTDDVIKFLKINDESLDFSELFKSHEIDGKAFLLLDSEMLMRYMKIKLGPALKIASIIDQLKRDQIS